MNVYKHKPKYCFAISVSLLRDIKVTRVRRKLVIQTKAVFVSKPNSCHLKLIITCYLFLCLCCRIVLRCFCFISHVTTSEIKLKQNCFVSVLFQFCFTCNHCLKGKVLLYSLPSIGPRADPGVQAVSPLVTSWWWAAITFHQTCSHLPSRRTSPSFDQYQVILLGDRGT